MQTIKLIEKLQALVDAHNSSGAREMMGEHEIVIDMFIEGPAEYHKEHTFKYAGFGNDIQIHKSSDGVYDILNAFAEPDTR